MASRLQVKGKPCRLHLSVAAGGSSTESKEEEVQLQLRSLHSNYTSPKFTATTTKRCIADLPPVPFQTTDFDSLKGAKFSETYPQKQAMIIDILLDSNVSISLLGQPAPFHETFHGPKILRSKLGDVLCGDYASKSEAASGVVGIVACVMKKEKEREVYDMWRRFFSLEDLGFKDVPGDGQHSLADVEALRLMEKHTYYSEKEKKFWTGLPFKEDPVETLSSNRAASYRLAISSHKKAAKDGMSAAVDAAFQKMVDINACERIPLKETHVASCYHLPTFPVYNPRSSSTKCRLVQNGSSAGKGGKSLNAIIHVGPVTDYMCDIGKSLIRIRLFEVLILADLEKMFWRIGIIKEHVDYQRFFHIPPKATEPQCFRMTSCVMGIASSPFAAMFVVRKLCDKFQSQYPDAVKAVRSSQYIDDLCATADTVGEAVKIAQQMPGLFSHAGMRVHKFQSSDTSVLDRARINEADRATGDVVRILGLQWRREGDLLEFSYKDAIDESKKVDSRRTLLSCLGRLWDPLGLINPFVLYGKIILKGTWVEGIGWDTPLSGETLASWRIFKNAIQQLDHLTQPRMLVPREHKREAWLAVLTDASKVAMGVCCYAITPGQSRLLFSKSRLLPEKQVNTKDARLTIPRAELLALLLGSRCADYISEAMGENFFSHVTYFSDSLLNIYRVKRQTPSRYKPWVANRLFELQKRMGKAEVHWLPGIDNSSDLASRGCLPNELIDNDLWNFGPPWLLKGKEEWPSHALTKEESESIENVDSGERRAAEKAISAAVHKRVGHAPFYALTERVSNFGRVKRIVCYVFRFLLKKCKSLPAKTKIFSQAVVDRTGVITVGELELVLTFFVRQAQLSAYSADLVYEGKDLRVRGDSSISSYGSYVDNFDCLRCVNRLDYSNKFPEGVRRPLLLPKRSLLVEKIVLQLHALHTHATLSTMFYILSRKMFLVGGRREMARILHLCRAKSCRRIVKLQAPLPPLPTIRTDHDATSPAFKNASCDFWGPVYFKNEEPCDCAAPERKGYGLIFTDLYSRSVSLELVRSQSTEDFWFAFVKLCARRGTPETMFSDQSLTLKAASREITRIYKSLDKQKIQDQAVSVGCTWTFNTSRAPWGNAISERLVRTVKTALKATFASTSKLTFSHLEGCIYTCEKLCNDRPLSALSENYDSNGTVTPSLITHGRLLQNLPFDHTPLKDGVPFSRMQSHRKLLVQHFFKRWRKEYLMANLASKFASGGGQIPINVGQIVLIKEEGLKPYFKLGRIVELLKSADSMVRRVKVKTANGSILDRHIQHICLTEEDVIKQRNEKANNAST